jgi:hypothetical protein
MFPGEQLPISQFIREACCVHDVGTAQRVLPGLGHRDDMHGVGQTYVEFHG